MFDLQCQNVTKQFGALTAVSGVSLDVPAGSFFSILGPSGCGKTTLMRMIAGFETPASGDIRIKGRSVVGTPPNKRNVKMVFQHLALFPMMNVGENIAYGLRCRGAGKAEIADKVRDVLERIGLPGVADKQVDQLSGGQKQRIAIARCMVLEPDVLLLDEPLGALDLKLRERMKIELKLLQHQFDTTFLYITHDQSEALVMSDNVAVMNAGQLRADRHAAGTLPPAEQRLRRRLRRRQQPLARTGRVGGGRGLQRRDRWRRPSCRRQQADQLARGEEVEVFVRPEAIAIGPQGSADGSNRLAGTVDSLLFNGANSRILVRSAAGAAGRGRQPGGAERTPPLRPGDAVELSFAHARTLCFAAAARP